MKMKRRPGKHSPARAHAWPAIRAQGGRRAIRLLGSTCAAWALSAGTAAASEPSPASVLAPIVVTATLSAAPAFDVPASITSLDVGGPVVPMRNVDVSEYLRQVPGVLARSRQNYAQDEQVSIRGFGARSTFGVRGIRLYADGIPATMPDGQGQVSNFDLDAATRIEVLRGPFSALYGNSSGGVISIFTADGARPSEVRAGAGGGSSGTFRADVGARGAVAGRGFGYNLDLSQFQTAGFRAHSRATRTLGNAKLDFRVGPGGKLSVVFNSLAMPLALDPQGLTRAQYDADPRQASASALTYDTRKSVHQAQVGARWEQALGATQSLQALVYSGHRGVLQFLSVPVAAQRNPLSSGGVVDLDTSYSGADFRYASHAAFLGAPLDFTAGVAVDGERQHRLGHENFRGTTLGVMGALRRDEQDDVYNIDEYAQATWKPAPRWSATLGARHSVVRFRSRDAYVTPANPDDSGRVAYGSTNPVAGLLFDATAHWHFYAAWGHGFATPTFSELGYRAEGSGLNFALRPSRSRNAELGAKWRNGNGARIELAWFDTHTDNEIGVLQSAGGRTVYQNSGAARRRGMELGAHVPIPLDFALDLAYTRLDARLAGGPGACAPGTACTPPPRSRLPGVPRQAVHAALTFANARGWHAALALDASSAVDADNAGALVAPGYATVGVSAAYRFETARRVVTPYLRIDNLADRRYIGSVIVEQANGGSFEPAPGRTYFAGVKVTLRAPSDG